ncbi:MAG: leucine-rich repeat domain-containing protein [Corticimicrobacter sp.]|uniref:leucine-rich repeat domain-containing protein n=1 Tax=Corticimicrobacter sp. TaxID=2678536 RepID=UPI0032D9DB6B
MKHHFADLLDRDGFHWNMVPNQERYRYRIDDMSPGDDTVRAVTIGKHDLQRDLLPTLPNVEEVTLHEPDQQQLCELSGIKNLKRLRISHVRLKDIDFIAELSGVEELVMEYVSGFSDLSPLKRLPVLRSLHLENLRKVSDFSGLDGLVQLKYLRIDGTLDWKQPILNFEFLRGLTGLEVLSFGQVISKAAYPAFLPARHLRHLKKIRVPSNMFDMAEYALLSVMLPEVQGADWRAYHHTCYSYLPLQEGDARLHMPLEKLKVHHPEVIVIHTGERRVPDPEFEWFECTGKKSGRIKCKHPDSDARCREYEENFAAMKNNAERVLAGISGLEKV